MGIVKITYLMIIVCLLLVGTVSATYTSEYPTQDADHVKATTENSEGTYKPYFATDPAKSLVGTRVSNSWIAGAGMNTNQRFHIDLGSAKIIRNVYYENNHEAGDSTTYAAKTFTMWGSNTSGDFSNLTYASDNPPGWVQLDANATQFDKHIIANTADPKYFTIDNAVAYRYYAFKISDGWGGTYMSIRRIELQTEDGYTPPVERSVVSTITHDFGSTISYALITLTVPGEIFSVSNLTNTTFDLTITNATTGLAGTNQTVYWCVG